MKVGSTPPRFAGKGEYDRDKARASIRTLSAKIQLVQGFALVEVSEYQHGQVLLERSAVVL